SASARKLVSKRLSAGPNFSASAMASSSIFSALTYSPSWYRVVPFSLYVFQTVSCANTGRQRLTASAVNSTAAVVGLPPRPLLSLISQSSLAGGHQNWRLLAVIGQLEPVGFLESCRLQHALQLAGREDAAGGGQQIHIERKQQRQSRSRTVVVGHEFCNHQQTALLHGLVTFGEKLRRRRQTLGMQDVP